MDLLASLKYVRSQHDIEYDTNGWPDPKFFTFVHGSNEPWFPRANHTKWLTPRLFFPRSLSCPCTFPPRPGFSSRRSWASIYCGKFLCHRADDPPKMAIIRIYLQIPIVGTEFQNSRVRAKQAAPPRTHVELSALKDLKGMKCDVVPDLLCYQEQVQDQDGIVPRGYATYVVWDKPPGGASHLGDILESRPSLAPSDPRPLPCCLRVSLLYPRPGSGGKRPERCGVAGGVWLEWANDMPANVRQDPRLVRRRGRSS
jgi:hypothetical protein